MRLEGYEGLAVAITKQAAHDYCECLRWMEAHGDKTIDANYEIDRYTRERELCVRHKDWKGAAHCTERIRHYKHQSEIEIEIADITEWFHSNIYHTISEIDGDSLLESIQRQLKKDPKFRVLLGDDI